jgi:hypothetical protein
MNRSTPRPRGSVSDGCAIQLFIWVIVPLIGFWPAVVWHGAGGWIGSAVWLLSAITVVAVVAIMRRKKKKTTPEFRDTDEAKRRNAVEKNRTQLATAQYTADFCSQGYNLEAAQALARKRFRDKDHPRRAWSASGIKGEREQAEQQRKIDAGDLARCPRCAQFAPASQEVILAHATRTRGPCEGEGTVKPWGEDPAAGNAPSARSAVRRQAKVRGCGRP